MGIDLEEDLSLLDLVPFLEGDVGEDTADLRLDLRRLHRLDDAVRGQVVGHIATHCARDGHRDRRPVRLLILAEAGDGN